jgi:hypothetical protein
LAQPLWMTHRSLLLEIIPKLGSDELDRLARGALSRSSAAAQRLGFLLSEAGQSLPAELQELRPRSTAELDPSRHGRHFSTRWRLYA